MITTDHLVKSGVVGTFPVSVRAIAMATRRFVLAVIVAVASALVIPALTAEALLLDLTGADAVGSSESTAAENAFDNNSGTRWQASDLGTDAYPQWIYVNLNTSQWKDRPIWIQQVDIDWGDATPTEYSLYVGWNSAPNPDTNLADWDLIGSMTSRTGANTGGGSFDERWDFQNDSMVFNSGSGTAGNFDIRRGSWLLIHATAGSGPLSIWEIDVYGAAIPEPSTLALLGIGSVMLYRLHRRFRLPVA